ncbi:hypothetical protein TRFO_02992 [Tritrichomonas foetus]|uniref:Uncharacterized protein n=1 Tax=Tritrichomonas foetus TaxID=1144522 RepID=A0A1J4KYS9_9EUKA|nr:hypothetical protein TRFO_02992 [Tritrichomonas foetus]|eukprot:OHT14733.1 hypothetical protein TRFO_02992 [Tritrichomonas foetus]
MCKEVDQSQDSQNKKKSGATAKPADKKGTPNNTENGNVKNSGNVEGESSQKFSQAGQEKESVLKYQNKSDSSSSSYTSTDMSSYEPSTTT